MCEHEGRCIYCQHIKGFNFKHPSFKSLGRTHKLGCGTGNNFKCAICKKEKSPLTDD